MNTWRPTVSADDLVSDIREKRNRFLKQRETSCTYRPTHFLLWCSLLLPSPLCFGRSVFNFLRHCCLSLHLWAWSNSLSCHELILVLRKMCILISPLNDFCNENKVEFLRCCFINLVIQHTLQVLFILSSTLYLLNVFKHCFCSHL